MPRRALFTALRRRADFAGAERFWLFVGHPRSGHSLVGALLDAQPDAVIAHELDVLGFLEAGERRRARLMALCVERNRWFAARKGRWNEYAYAVEAGWQGRHRRLRVIGDKKGGRTTLRLRRNPELLDELRAIIQLPLRLIQVVRHPLDNIATMSVKRKEPLPRTIDEYFGRAEFLDGFLAGLPSEEQYTVSFEAVSRDPEARLGELIQFLGLPQDAVAGAARAQAAAIVRPEPSRSRRRVAWTPALLEDVRARSAALGHLHGYVGGSEGDDWRAD